MKDFNDMVFHPMSEDLVKTLCARTDNLNPLFFRVHLAFYWGQLASMMRNNLNTIDRGELPINIYAINMMTSGAGKGFATAFIEEQIVNQFYLNFKEQTLPALSAQNLNLLSIDRAARNNTDVSYELSKLTHDYDVECGEYLISFDSGTKEGLKQARNKLLLANLGSANLIMDEMGSNLAGNEEMINTFIELYDIGKVKSKLIKNTNENKRFEDIDGRTPACVMMFGTPSRCLDGGKTEGLLFVNLETGLGRRAIYGYSKSHEKNEDLSPKEILELAKNAQSDPANKDLSNRIGKLALASNAHKLIDIPEDVALLFIEYRLDCQKRSKELPDHEVLRKPELDHRYFKAMKLAGAYAFIDNQPTVTEQYFDYAVKLVEASGDAFNQMLTRDKKHVRLAKYLGEINKPVTQSDLVEDLSYYRGNTQSKVEMLQLATAYGYQNNILIKKRYEEGIEFIYGEALKKTNVNQLTISYSNDVAYQYLNDVVAFDELHNLTNLPDMHWCSHHLINGHRQEDNAVAGFNLIVLDVENSVPLSVAQTLLKEYKALFYVTKRHTKDSNRYRVILPTNFVLQLDAKDFKEFMKNVFAWLPFEVDVATAQRARKWLTNEGHFTYQDGELIDVLPFIPKTSKNDNFLKDQIDQAGLDNLERWVLNNSGDGNRNNMLLRYALILVDANLSYTDCANKILGLNNKLDKPLKTTEIESTIFKTVRITIDKRQVA
jgi:hypothetical protein